MFKGKSFSWFVLEACFLTHYLADSPSSPFTSCILKWCSSLELGTHSQFCHTTSFAAAWGHFRGETIYSRRLASGQFHIVHRPYADAARVTSDSTPNGGHCIVSSASFLCSPARAHPHRTRVLALPRRAFEGAASGERQCGEPGGQNSLQLYHLTPVCVAPMIPWMFPLLNDGVGLEQEFYTMFF